jgi:tetratricopeptide (TPR) repeat protein
VWDVVPGEIVTVLPRKHWSYAGHPYLSADITGTRFDLGALNLQPLKLNDFGIWDPGRHYWGEDDAPELDWEKAIKSRGSRPEYEMEQILPGVSPEDLDIDTDPITEAVELKEAGEFAEAHQVLNTLLIADLRCLDAHAHLGNLEFDRQPATALRHYDIGRQIGEISLGPDFPGVLPWGLVDNRPYLRCLHGYGLCLWRLKRLDEAAIVFTRMLWLNPADNQGVRFLLPEVREGTAWKDRPDL